MYLQRFQNRPTSRQLFVWRWLNLLHSQRCITPKLIERWNKHTHTTMGNKFHIRRSKIVSWACSNIHATPCKNEICWLKHPHTHTHICTISLYLWYKCMHACNSLPFLEYYEYHIISQIEVDKMCYIVIVNAIIVPFCCVAFSIGWRVGSNISQFDSHYWRYAFFAASYDNDVIYP